MNTWNTAPLWIALLLAGCTYGRQTIRVDAEGGWSASVSLTRVLMTESLAGGKTEWTADRSGMIVTDAVTNRFLRPDAQTVEAIAAGVAERLLKSGLLAP